MDIEGSPFTAHHILEPKRRNPASSGPRRVRDGSRDHHIRWKTWKASLQREASRWKTQFHAGTSNEGLDFART